MRSLARLAIALAAALTASAAASADQSTIDPSALSAVRAYIAALTKPDAAAAYALLTPAQRSYFGREANFASDLSTTQYRIVSWSIASSRQRNAALAEIDVRQTVSYLDISTGQSATATIVEPYFALRSNGAWGVKELAQPWKSYAPRAQSRAGGLVAIIDRIEFYDRRVKIDCTLQNMGSDALQALPLLKSTMTFAGSPPVHALDAPDYPLNDQQFFEGVRIYPKHQAVGFINFPLPSRTDADVTVTITIAPIIPDGATSPWAATIGPIALPRL
jgi:hypothetical protein